jgi:DNA-directed RNA polymerase sigma subunit (sigma70/sigma32)
MARQLGIPVNQVKDILRATRPTVSINAPAYDSRSGKGQNKEVQLLDTLSTESKVGKRKVKDKFSIPLYTQPSISDGSNDTPKKNSKIYSMFDKHLNATEKHVLELFLGTSNGQTDTSHALTFNQIEKKLNLGKHKAKEITEIAIAKLRANVNDKADDGRKRGGRYG